jgi:transcriptional regulator with XRE-family HTH domain
VDSIDPRSLDRAPVTNMIVAEDLGLDHSMVSRIRSNDRNPSFAVMAKIEEVFHWAMVDQLTARKEGRYGEQFEWVLANQYEPVLD